MDRIKKLLCAVSELPPSAFGEKPYIEIESNSSLKLDCCREILSYTENEVSFLTDESVIVVEGNGLELCSFGNSTVRITGDIRGLKIGREGV